MRRAAVPAVLAVALLGAWASAAHAVPFNVTSTADAVDTNPGNGVCQAVAPLGCTLRAAVMEANALVGPDEINVPARANPYLLIIPPDTSPNDAEDGDLDITQDVTISGAGAAGTIVNAGGDNGIGDRVFHIPAPQSASATISGLTITGGRSNADGGGVNSEGNLILLDSVVTDNQGGRLSEGGGIVENGGVGTVTIRNSTVSQNIAWFGGGVSENGSGDVEIFDSRIVANRATGDSQSNGGGVIEDGGGSLTIDRSDVSGNVVDGYLGGGVSENGGGPVTITNSLISGNRVSDPVVDQSFARGGGIGEDGGGLVSVVNSTITGNSVQGLPGEPANGGGIADTGGGGVSLLNTTVASNTADGVGGNLYNAGGDAMTVKNSIVAAGSPANCAALPGSAITSQGDNIDSGTGCGFTAPGDLPGTDPLLAALANNGGPTPTRALQPGSPAIDAADGSVCPATDQRGVARPQSVGCDIGAFEVAVAPPDTTPPETVILSAVVQGRSASFTFSASELGATFECSLDGSPFLACGSFTTPPLAGGPHVFMVRARDAAGNVDPTPAVFEFRIPLRLSDLPDPVLGSLVNVEPVGTVLWAPRPAGARAGARASQKGLQFVPLEEARQIPAGSFLDTRRGSVILQSARNRRGAKQQGTFESGVFQILQSRARRARGLTELRLKGSSFRRCRTGRRGRAGASQVSRRTIRRVRSNANGNFRTRGRNSAATVRGTVWITADRCDGTLTTVRRGRVAVRDFRLKRTVIVRAGKSYLARAPK